MMIVCVGFVSCGGDDDKDDNNSRDEIEYEEDINSDLIGWWLSSVQVSETKDPYNLIYYIHFIDKSTVEWGRAWTVTDSSLSGEFLFTYSSKKFYKITDDYNISSYTRLNTSVIMQNGASLILKNNNFYWGAGSTYTFEDNVSPDR